MKESLPTTREAFILWLEGKRGRVPRLASILEEAGYRLERVRRGRDGLAVLQRATPRLIVIYAASLGSSGIRLVQQFHREAPNIPQLLILARGADLRKTHVPYGKALRLPLSQKRLLREVRRYFPSPDQEEHWEDYGPFRFDAVRGRVWRNGREWPLTPKMARLLAYFLQHPNRVIPREELFRAVWNMPSNNDLRTLEVHICWLRKVLEDNPRKPKLLRTLRGRGYLLELPLNLETGDKA